MTPADYQFLQRLLKDRSGLDLSADKEYLIESRLLPIARKSGLSGIDGLVRKIKAGAEDVIKQVVEAMTTNETFFFRDGIPFEHLRETVLPALLRARASRRALRIWSAACSTGQEPYSIAMCLKEFGGELNSWRIEIVATDLSQAVLEKARCGKFSQFDVQRGLPIQLLVKYFQQVGEMWQINPDIRAMVQFRPLNLLHDIAQLGVFDVVFCRNVLIYFDPETKSAIFRQLAKATTSDGYLALGAAETVVGLTDTFRPVAGCRGLYSPTPVRAAPPLALRDVSPLPGGVASAAS